MEPYGKTLVIVGLSLATLGALLWASASVPWMGKLPGDIYIKRGNFTFYFPLATCIVLSLVVSAVIALLRR
ncbi:MAG: DUF2905 domain-containing protein [Candidatus Binataceae bacterium]